MWLLGLWTWIRPLPTLALRLGVGIPRVSRVPVPCSFSTVLFALRTTPARTSRFTCPSSIHSTCGPSPIHPTRLLAMSLPPASDYPPTAFFAVHKGVKTGVFATYNELIANIKDYLNPKWEAFSNRAHAIEYVKTGQIPKGANPVQPGEHLSPVRRTVSAGAAKPGSSVARTPSTGAKMSASAPSAIKASGSSVKPNGKANPVVPGSKGRVSPAPLGKPSTKSSVAANSSGGQRNASTAASAGRGASGKVEVWTDGSCLDNGKPNARAAYAVYFGQDDPRNEAQRVPGVQTNNRGEVLGIIRALELVDENVEHLIVYTDSRYAIDCITRWLPGWIKKNGCTAGGKIAANYSMIRYADALIKRRGSRVELFHVNAHQDNVGNNAVDALARAAAQNDPIVPVERDWDDRRIKLERRPPIQTKGPAKIKVEEAAVDEWGSDYGYDDDDIDMGDDFDVEVIEIPDSKPAPPAPVAPSTTGPMASSIAKTLKRTRDEAKSRETANKPGEDEIPDSDTERKASRKAGKRRQVECPSCQHKFPVVFQK